MADPAAYNKTVSLTGRNHCNVTMRQAGGQSRRSCEFALKRRAPGAQYLSWKAGIRVPRILPDPGGLKYNYRRCAEEPAYSHGGGGRSGST